jgi:hypothetical protein
VFNALFPNFRKHSQVLLNGIECSAVWLVWMGGCMRLTCVAFVALTVLGSSQMALGEFRIADDQGGQIGAYLERFSDIRDRGERVVVDGICASACTAMLGIIPRSRTCVTTRAVFKFHSAWDLAPTGGVPSRAGNRLLWAYYPSDVRKWISTHGGLTSHVIELRGHELSKMYRACP